MSGHRPTDGSNPQSQRPAVAHGSRRPQSSRGHPPRGRPSLGGNSWGSQRTGSADACASHGASPSGSQRPEGGSPWAGQQHAGIYPWTSPLPDGGYYCEGQQPVDGYTWAVQQPTGDGQQPAFNGTLTYTQFRANMMASERREAEGREKTREKSAAELEMAAKRASMKESVHGRLRAARGITREEKFQRAEESARGFCESDDETFIPNIKE